MEVKKGNTYFQWRRSRRLQPILLEVLKVNERTEYHDICEVRWYVMWKDKYSKSEFPMATIDGEFVDFVPIPRKAYLEAVNILKTMDNYKNAKRRVLYRMKKILDTNCDKDKQKNKEL